MDPEMTPYDILIKMLNGEILTRVIQQQLNVTSNQTEYVYMAWGVPIPPEQFYLYGFIEFEILIRKYCHKQWWTAPEAINRMVTK